MSDRELELCERRALALGPSPRDTSLLHGLLTDTGIPCVVCTGSDALLAQMGRGVGALLVTDEAVLGGAHAAIAQYVAHQPAWSELPVVILTERGYDSPEIAQLLEILGNVTLVERPVRIAVLVSTLRAALRARDRQYQIRAHLIERERNEESLREADRRKDEFLATLAHELRNPLAPISNTLHLLRHTDMSQSEAAWGREVIDRQVRSLTRLVDDLLDVSRITRGKLALRRENVDLEAVMRNAVETSRPLLEAAGHEFKLDLPSAPVLLDADPVRLAQALSNLLNNAAKYTPAGGRITLAAELAGDAAVIRVTDSGVGIAAGMLPRVFELFVQADNGVARSQGGLGIGLTLVRTFVELHGGSIEAHSAGPDRGSEFVIRLPTVVRAGRAPAEARVPNLQAEEASRRRVLIVDDNEDGAQSLGLLLEMDGNDVRTANDGLQALATLGDFRPDVVLLDIGLPTLNGYETARRMRVHPNARGALLIALTCWGQAEDRRRSREAGFDHHLVKPVDLGTLQTLLAHERVH